MRTTLLAIGKLRPSLRAACDDYLKRLRRYGPIGESELREAGRIGNPLLRRREETARLAARVSSGDTLVVLDRMGSAWTSQELARRLQRWRQAARPVTLVIGGAVGLDPASLPAGALHWSLGPLTLAHELARVVVLEQWYRAWTILRGEPYHR